MNNVVEIAGEAYKVEYANSSYMKLDRDYGYDFSQKDFERLERQDNPSFSTVFKFIALGLIKHHENENLEDVLDEIDLMEFFDSPKIEVFVEQFRKAHPEPEQVEEDTGKNE